MRDEVVGIQQTVVETIQEEMVKLTQKFNKTIAEVVGN